MKRSKKSVQIGAPAVTVAVERKQERFFLIAVAQSLGLIPVSMQRLRENATHVVVYNKDCMGFALASHYGKIGKPNNAEGGRGERRLLVIFFKKN